jgi:hypothetical protein
VEFPKTSPDLLFKPCGIRQKWRKKLAGGLQPTPANNFFIPLLALDNCYRGNAVRKCHSAFLISILIFSHKNAQKEQKL